MSFRRYVSVSFLGVCLAAAALLAMSASAYAAAPEAPELVQPGYVSATATTLEGVLDPGQEGAPGTFESLTYEFVYRPSATECEGAGQATTPAGVSLGEGKERVSQAISGLTQGTRYTACLRVSGSGAKAISPPVSFKTAITPETPTGEEATEIGGTTATLKAILNPDNEGEAGEYWFFYGQGASNCEQQETRPYGVSAGHLQEPVQATVSGLLPHTTYTFCAGVRNGAFEITVGRPVTFTTTTETPTVADESSVTVASGEATLAAQIGPGGLITTYLIEYGHTNEYGSSAPAENLPASSMPVGVQQGLVGLDPGTEYHYRYVATNSRGTTYGTDATFLTAKAIGMTAPILPDSRAYELVSGLEDTEVYPPNYEHNPEEGVAGEFDGLGDKYRASVNGNAVAYMGDPPASGVTGSGATGSGDGNQYLASRTASDWSAEDIDLPVVSATAEGLPEFRPFSGDLSIFTVQTTIPVNAVPQKPAGCLQSTLYSLDASGYHSLIGDEGRPGLCFAVPAAVSADDSHTLFYSRYAFVPGASEGAEFTETNLYDSVEGSLHQVNVLPNGAPESDPNATFGGPTGEEVTEESRFDFDRAISSNGSRIFWTDLKEETTPEDPSGGTRLFVRENDTQPQSPIGPAGECSVAADACTVQVDKTQGGSGASGGGRYWTASSDGSIVFFTDESKLTADSSASVGEPDLYEFNVDSGRLFDLTPAPAGMHAEVQGVMGASEDGTYVYFVANGVLTEGSNVEGHSPMPGRPNVYVSHEGRLAFIVTLDGGIPGDRTHPGDNDFEISGRGGTDQHSGDWRGEPGDRTAEVAPDGHAVTFMSRLSLTGYDNYTAGEQPALPEVFVYETEMGRLVCASCDPSGLPPGTTAERWEESRGGYLGMSTSPEYQLRFINSDGTQVYFMTSQPLVAQDTNRYQDVYEWEQDGSDGCELPAGCVSLLSAGSSGNAAYFVDSSSSGDDVFFSSRADLVKGIVNENVKLYDARVNGGFPEVSLACTGTGCQGVPPASPVFATPSSVTFDGVGNFEAAAPNTATLKKKAKTVAQLRADRLARALAVCRHGPKRRRSHCEKQARKRYAPAKKRGKR